MDFVNASRMAAGYNVGLEPSGRELLVVVIKGTFRIPCSGEQVRLHEVQQPLVMADTFSGAPGVSAPVHEVDFAPHKARCDVLLVGHAHAPGGSPVTRMQVGMRVGQMEKICDVVGNRLWQAGATGISMSAAEPFVQMPLSYDLAFGGTDQHSEDASEHDAYGPNPVGRGWHKHLNSAWVDGSPLPNLEDPAQSVSFPTDACKPMAFGPLGRGWHQRVRFAGTYDAQWRKDVFPFLPADFDPRYYQAAPQDQQLPLPQGPLEVVLQGVTPGEALSFVLPAFDAPVQMTTRRGERETHAGVLDTIVFEPDHMRMTLTWRVTRPLRDSIFDLLQVQVGVRGRKVAQHA